MELSYKISAYEFKMSNIYPTGFIDESSEVLWSLIGAMKLNFSSKFLINFKP